MTFQLTTPTQRTFRAKFGSLPQISFVPRLSESEISAMSLREVTAGYTNDMVAANNAARRSSFGYVAGPDGLRIGQAPSSFGAPPAPSGNVVFARFDDLLDKWLLAAPKTLYVSANPDTSGARITKTGAPDEALDVPPLRVVASNQNVSFETQSTTLIWPQLLEQYFKDVFPGFQLEVIRATGWGSTNAPVNQSLASVRDTLLTDPPPGRCWVTSFFDLESTGRTYGAFVGLVGSVPAVGAFYGVRAIGMNKYAYTAAYTGRSDLLNGRLRESVLIELTEAGAALHAAGALSRYSNREDVGYLKLPGVIAAAGFSPMFDVVDSLVANPGERVVDGTIYGVGAMVHGPQWISAFTSGQVVDGQYDDSVISVTMPGSKLVQISGATGDDAAKLLATDFVLTVLRNPVKLGSLVEATYGWDELDSDGRQELLDTVMLTHEGVQYTIGQANDRAKDTTARDLVLMKVKKLLYGTAAIVSGTAEAPVYTCLEAGMIRASDLDEWLAHALENRATCTVPTYTVGTWSVAKVGYDATQGIGVVTGGALADPARLMTESEAVAAGLLNPEAWGDANSRAWFWLTQVVASRDSVKDIIRTAFAGHMMLKQTVKLA